MVLPGLKVPAAQHVQLLLPFAALKEPAAHGMQAIWPVRALVEVPAGHARHAEEEFWPERGLYVSVGHGRHVCRVPLAWHIGQLANKTRSGRADVIGPRT